MINMNHLITIDNIWLAIGFGGQILFAMRFLVQWLSSEKQRKSVIPVSFWYFSIVGGFTLLAYAIYIRDPVFICGQLFGSFVYSRNLYFIYKERERDAKDEVAQENSA